MIAISVLTGCAANNPYDADVQDWPERERLDTETRLDDINKVSYLSRALMESDNRAEIISEITNTAVYQKGMSATTKGSIAGAVTDISNGTVLTGSHSAGQVQLAVMAGSFLLGEFSDGSNENTSKAWIESVVDGSAIDTPEKAKQVLIHRTEAKIQAIGDKLGWKTTCIDGCGTNRAIYLLENTENKPLPLNYTYRPNELVAYVSFVNTLTEVEPNDPVKALIDPEVKWETKGYDAFRVNFYADNIKRNEDGSVSLSVGEDGRKYTHSRRNLKETKLGRALYQAYHNDPYSIWGSQNEYPNVIYYNGEVYSFVSNSRTRLASYKMMVTPLTSN